MQYDVIHKCATLFIMTLGNVLPKLERAVALSEHSDTAVSTDFLGKNFHLFL